MFQMDDQNDKYLTIWYGVYNQARRQLIYSSAGHPPALLISKAPENGVVEVKQLKTGSLPIGMMPDTKFVNQRCDIGVGSTLYVFSDGVYEIIKPDGEIWGLQGLIDLVCSQQEVISVQGLNYILNYIKTLSPNEAFEDDVSLLRIDFSK
jgi:sigma-B regulation protein RsbU (phosphoserine phosphatase)